MSNKKTKFEEFKELYEFNSGSLKWIPKGGELLKYIGQEVVLVIYSKDENGEWKNTFKAANVISINDYDPVTMTYNIKYQVLNGGIPDGEPKEERIIPEGFSFDVMGQGIQDTMNRFVPYSYHLRVVEEEAYYKRVGELFDSRDTIPFDAIKTLAQSKEQGNTLGYAKNIIAAVRPTKEIEGEETEDLEYTGELFVFRVNQIKIRHEHKDTWRLIISDINNKSYSVVVTAEDTFYELRHMGENIGDLKLIDLTDINTEETDETVC